MYSIVCDGVRVGSLLVGDYDAALEIARELNRGAGAANGRQPFRVEPLHGQCATCEPPAPLHQQSSRAS